MEAALSMPRYDFASLILKTYIQCVAVCVMVVVPGSSLTRVLRLQVPVAAPCRYPLQLLRAVPPCTGAEALVVAGMLVDLVPQVGGVSLAAAATAIVSKYLTIFFESSANSQHRPK